METNITALSFWRKSLAQSSIALRLRGLGILAILMIAAIGVLALNGIGRMGTNLQSVTISGQALRNHLECDMMHDAIRGDVFASLSGLADEKTTKEELKTHIEWFRKAVKANQALPLDPETTSLLAQASVKLEGYAAAAREMCALAYSNPRQARIKLPKFTEVFEEIEKQNETLSDHIQKSAADAEKTALADAASIRSFFLFFAIAGALVMFLLAAWIGRSVTHPIGNMVDKLEQVAKGHLHVQADVSGGEEVARMATALNLALSNIRSTMMVIRDASSSIRSASQSLNLRNENISAAAYATAASATELSSSGTEVSDRLQGVSSSGLELSASIREISSQASSAANLAHKASSAANSANALFSVLETTNQEIGNVVAVISSIADQTNLLALNAAIEAARAGDAGRGFAVVAAEVKELASQTSTATEEISTRIAGIQSQTTRAVEAIRALTEIINSVNHVSTTTIAAAVEEQTAVTKGIEEQLFDASRGTQDISSSVNSLAENANITSTNAAESLSAARQLDGIARTLQDSVDTFVLTA